MPNDSHNKANIELQGYDYSSSGIYFVTICTQNKLCLFGEVINSEILLNEPGKMLMQVYNELSDKFPDIRCHEIIIMPNHIHFIIENVAANRPISQIDTNNELSEHIGSPLYPIIQWFKSSTKNLYIDGVKKFGWKPFYKKIWQLNYHEHIIRSEESYISITESMISNPTNWESDEYYINQTHQ